MNSRIKAIFYLVILTAAASQLNAARLLVAPSGVATDNQGNVYVVDRQNGRGSIYKYAPKGERFPEPTDGFANTGIGAMAVNKTNGIIYFTTDSNRKLWKLSPNGSGTGSGWSIVRYEPKTGLDSDPTGLAVDKDGNVYISTSRSLDKFDEKGNLVSEATGLYGYKVAGVDSKNRVYLTTDNGKELMRVKLLPDGRSYTMARVPTKYACDAVAIDDVDNVYIADREKHTIRKHPADDGLESVFRSEYGDLRGLAVSGNQLYIANGVDGVLKVDADSGQCAGIRLFTINKPYNYFARVGDDGPYYMSYTLYPKEEGSIDLYNSNGTFNIHVADGGQAKGLALDNNNNLICTLRDIRGEWDYHPNTVEWRRGGQPTKVLWLMGRQIEGLATFRLGEAEKDQGIVVARDNKLVYTSTDFIMDAFTGKVIADGIDGIRGVAAAKNGNVYWVSTKDNVLGRGVCRKGTVDGYPYWDVDKKFIEGLSYPEAVVVDDNYIYVTNSCSDENKRHIGRYGLDGKFLSDLYSEGMRNRDADQMYLRGIIADSNGRDITVLQRYGDNCEVWKYSNVFAN